MDNTLRQRITGYLAGGGLFNPELANHDAVRDLLIDCRDKLAAIDGAEMPEETKWIKHMRIATLDNCVPHESEYLAYVDALKLFAQAQSARADEIRRQTIAECVAFIRNGRFLHDKAPPKLFADEVTKRMLEHFESIDAAIAAGKGEV
jgi:hypothetical protein